MHTYKHCLILHETESISNWLTLKLLKNVAPQKLPFFLLISFSWWSRSRIKHIIKTCHASITSGQIIQISILVLLAGNWVSLVFPVP